MGIAYLEGRFVEEGEAKIPISDRGFQFGDGAFSTIQVREGTPLFLESHLEQLKKQCHSFNLKMPEVSREIVEELISVNHAEQGVWRLKILVTGGDSPAVGLPAREGRVAGFVHPFVPDPFKALKMGIFSIPYSSCHASFKSLAHLNRFYVMEEAKRQGLDDSVTVTESGKVLEAAFGNLFWVKEKTLMTPDPSLPLYFGVTIKNILAIGSKLGFGVRYLQLPLTELPKECAAFRANTMQGVRPIAQIGTLSFARNPVVEALFINGYGELIEEQKKTHAISSMR